MICASISTDDAGTGIGAFVFPVPTPTDMSTCPVVLVTGAELGSLTAFAVPTPDQFAAAWAWGFSSVVTAYLIGWAVGSVVNFLRKR